MEYSNYKKSQGNSSNFQITKNLRETQGIFKLQKISGNFQITKNFRETQEILNLQKISGKLMEF